MATGCQGCCPGQAGSKLTLPSLRFGRRRGGRRWRRGTRSTIGFCDRTAQLLEQVGDGAIVGREPRQLFRIREGGCRISRIANSTPAREVT